MDLYGRTRPRGRRLDSSSTSNSSHRGTSFENNNIHDINHNHDGTQNRYRVMKHRNPKLGVLSLQSWLNFGESPSSPPSVPSLDDDFVYAKIGKPRTGIGQNVDAHSVSSWKPPKYESHRSSGSSGGDYTAAAAHILAEISVRANSESNTASSHGSNAGGVLQTPATVAPVSQSKTHNIRRWTSNRHSASVDNMRALDFHDRPNEQQRFAVNNPNSLKSADSFSRYSYSVVDTST
eukprot:Lankesteria_metandrocarpae@DN6628_c0_g1_i1.p1